ncbi:addiction module protein [Marinilabilia rubra]|uniref:Addiction module component CHP02574 family protein n=1 Tax=Marinilabilia rubra TaxID=2162893 RepID=A0A2U2BBN7_9BACT|nr:addiction module protein [Marinilabilia rubra]PWE00443.1 addiction module component CHP02574 family protein [Marinilabilia rubra]
MHLQYIPDKEGKTAGVFIPIKDWEKLKSKYKELEKEESSSFEIPDWHKNILDERLKMLEKDPDNLINWEEAKKNFNL